MTNYLDGILHTLLTPSGETNEVRLFFFLLLHRNGKKLGKGFGTCCMNKIL